MPTPNTLILLAIVVPILGAAAVLWRRPLVLALPFLAILNGVPLAAGGSTLRADQIGACLLLIPLTASVLTGERKLRIDATSWWIAALLAMNVVASVVNSPSVSFSLFQCANLAASWVIYFVLINFLDDRDMLDAFFVNALRAAVLAACIGTAAFLLALSGVHVGGAEVSVSAAERFTKAYGAFGTFVEPNLFGSFLAAFLVLAVSLLAAGARLPNDRGRSQLLRWSAVLCSAGLVVSFTRSAWIGAVFGIGYFLVMGRRLRGVRVSRVLMPLAVAIIVGVALLFLPGSAGTFLRFKIENLVNIGSQTVIVRLLTYVLALDQSIQHPIIGWGTFSFAPLVAQGNDFSQFENWRTLWIGNYLILALHDTGVIGLLLLIGVLWSVIALGMRTARLVDLTDPALRDRTLALTAATVSLLIPFLTTTGFSLGFPWLLMGLLAAHARLANAPRAEVAPEPTPAVDAHPVAAT